MLGLEPSTPFEEIARRYHALAAEQRSDEHPDDSSAARMVAITGAWNRIKHEVRKRRRRFASMSFEPEALTVCTWPHPASVRSRAFDGCELRPTEDARCYRVLRNGKLLLTLHRHPDDARLLFARNDDGRVVQVNGVAWWTDVDGEVGAVR